jgi:hypothetical protein
MDNSSQKVMKTTQIQIKEIKQVQHPEDYQKGYEEGKTETIGTIKKDTKREKQRPLEKSRRWPNTCIEMTS